LRMPHRYRQLWRARPAHWLAVARDGLPQVAGYHRGYRHRGKGGHGDFRRRCLQGPQPGPQPDQPGGNDEVVMEGEFHEA